MPGICFGKEFNKCDDEFKDICSVYLFHYLSSKIDLSPLCFILVTFMTPFCGKIALICFETFWEMILKHDCLVFDLCLD